MKKQNILTGIGLLVVLAVGISVGTMDRTHTVENPFDGVDESYPDVVKMQVVELADGDTFTLTAEIVKQKVGGRIIKRLAYNRQIPGPVIKVAKDSEITINFVNNIDVPTTLHSHGLRLDNAFDGVPDVTQKQIEVGETFAYTLTFPDEGVYWYHPHIREDYTQELGLYGNFIVEPNDKTYWSSVSQEESLILDDLLVGAEFDKEIIDHTLMGRFGDSLRINDSENFVLEINSLEVTRLYITNVANTRTFDIEIPQSNMKLVGGDIGRIEHEVFTQNLIIAPAERYIVEVMFIDGGTYPIKHRGVTIGTIIARGDKVNRDLLGVTLHEDSLRTNPTDYANIRENMESYLEQAPDKNVRLTLEMKMEHMMDDSEMMMGRDGEKMGDMMTESLIPHDDAEGDIHMHNDSVGIEWEDAMPNMNQMSTSDNIEWQIIDEETGLVNMDIDWSFAVGDMVKVRVFNDPTSVHPMQHPIHFHGQRFVVISRDGEENTNLQWKDTALVRKGETVDLIVEMTNPGTWMSHCHIAEHLHAGMMFGFEVK